MAGSQQLVITTSSARPLEAVAADLEKAGLVVEHVFDAIGSIVGHGSPAMIARLLAIDGVVDVSPATDVGIGPPGDGTTW